jgi:c-di-AMP phosphodiesterase-like protein
MKKEISKEPFQTLPLFFLIIAMMVSLIIYVFVNNNSPVAKALSLILLLACGILFWFVSVKFYRVSFDSQFIYYSHFKQSRKIDLKDVLEITPTAIPIRIFYLNSYIITITYLENDIKKKIRFFSKGAFKVVGSVNGIPHLEQLREKVLDKKYSR